jgi:hypothetical protein
MRPGRLNDHDRELWVRNDETLYLWWKSHKCSMRQFLREHRDELDSFINARLNQKPRP